MGNDSWRWADVDGNQRVVRLDELRAALASGVLAPNTPVWRPGFRAWQPAHEVPELMSSALSAANGVVPNIPPPPLTMVAVQQAFEARASDSFAPPNVGLQESNAALREPPSPPRYVPHVPHVPLPVVNAMPGAAPTMVGLPPPPGLAQLAAARSVLSVFSEPRAQPSVGLISPESSRRFAFDDTQLDAVVGRRARWDAFRDDLRAMKAGRAPKNVRLMAVVFTLSVMVFLSATACIATLLRPKPSALPSHGVTSALPETRGDTSRSLEVHVAKPEKPSSAEPAVREGCSSLGPARLLAPRAYAPAGLEVALGPTPTEGAMAVGFALDAHTAVGVPVDVSSPTGGMALGAMTKTRVQFGELRRVTPRFENGKLVLGTNAERKFDKIQGRRTLAATPGLDVGVTSGALVFAPHDQNTATKIWSFDRGESAIDAIRAVPLASRDNFAFVWRRGHAIGVGTAKGSAMQLTPDGDFSRIDGLGQVGAPSVAASGDTLLAVWSDRASAEASWALRGSTFNVGTAPGAPMAFALPAGGVGGQATSPSLAGLAGATNARFALAWSEGVSSHQVRVAAIAIDNEGRAALRTLGEALVLSPVDVNAGQPQVAVAPDGRGVVAFFGVKGSLSSVYAAPIACLVK